MPEKPMPRLAPLLMPLAALIFVIGGFSTLGEVLLHSPHFYTPVIALAFALCVTFGAALISWWLGRAEQRTEASSPRPSLPR